MPAIWPIALVILSNIVYQICAKSAPEAMHPLASLTVTYFVGAVCSLLLFFVLERGGNLLREYAKVNWAPFVLGLVIVGLASSMPTSWAGRSAEPASCKVLFSLWRCFLWDGCSTANR